MTDLFLVALYAVAIGGVMILVRGAIEIAPIARSRRDAARRALPVLSGLAALVFALLAVRRLLSDQPVVAAVAMVLVVAGFVVASWPALRDVAAGVFLKAGQICREGDHVRIGDVHGRVARLGLRVMVLETSDGEEAIIPFARVTRDRLLRTPAVEGVTPHVFRLPLPRGASMGELKATIRRSALLVHWSAVSREPEITVDGDHLEVTVYAIDPDRGTDIEVAVRRGVGGDVLLETPASRERLRESAPPQRMRGDALK